MLIAEECGFLFAIDSLIHTLAASLNLATSAVEVNSFNSSNPSNSNNSKSTQDIGNTGQTGSNTGQTGTSRPASERVRKTTMVDATKIQMQVVEMNNLSPFAEQDLVDNCKVQIVTIVEVFYSFACVLEKEHRLRSVVIMNSRIEALYNQYVLPLRESMGGNASSNTGATTSSGEQAPPPSVDFDNYLDFDMFTFPILMPVPGFGGKRGMLPRDMGRYQTRSYYYSTCLS